MSRSEPTAGLRHIRIGLLSASSRDLSVIGIILKHIKPAGCVFSLSSNPLVEPIGIAIVDAGDKDMLDQLAALRRQRLEFEVIHLVNMAGESGGRFEIERTKIALHLLEQLQRVVAAMDNTADLPPPEAHEVAAPPAWDNVVAIGAPTRPVRLRALVVDDSPTVRLQLSQVVRSIGLQADTADTGERALELIAGNHYDVAYVDVVMPGMDGYKLTRAIKREPSCRDTSVIILTSHTSALDRARGALAGCDAFMGKPVELKQFYEATANALRKTMAVDNLAQWITDPTVTRVEAPAVSGTSAGFARKGNAGNS